MNTNTFRQDARNKRDEMARELYVRYPRILRPGSVRYLAFGPGWFRLVDSFIAGVNDRLSDELASRFRLDQVKEKFGLMQIHYFVSPSEAAVRGESEVMKARAEDAPEFPFAEILALKSLVEKDSAQTCFFCGARGVRRQTLWTRVTCETCESKLEPKP